MELHHPAQRRVPRQAQGPASPASLPVSLPAHARPRTYMTRIIQLARGANVSCYQTNRHAAAIEPPEHNASQSCAMGQSHGIHGWGTVSLHRLAYMHLVCKVLFRMPFYIPHQICSSNGPLFQPQTRVGTGAASNNDDKEGHRGPQNTTRKRVSSIETPVEKGNPIF